MSKVVCQWQFNGLQYHCVHCYDMRQMADRLRRHVYVCSIPCCVLLSVLIVIIIIMFIVMIQ